MLIYGSLDKNLKDVVEIDRKLRSLSVRCNMLARRLVRCTKTGLGLQHVTHNVWKPQNTFHCLRDRNTNIGWCELRNPISIALRLRNPINQFANKKHEIEHLCKRHYVTDAYLVSRYVNTSDDIKIKTFRQLDKAIIYIHWAPYP